MSVSDSAVKGFVKNVKENLLYLRHKPKPIIMKKTFTLLCLLFAFAVSAQDKITEVPVNIKFYDALQIVKKNSHFDFLQKPEKMNEVSDSSGKIKGYTVVTDKYKISMKLITENLTEIEILSVDEFYSLSLFRDRLTGHGFINDLKLNRLLTYYFQDNKTIKDSVLNFGR